MAKLCWNSLAYCCSLEKECEDRDRIMKEIGLNKKEYIKLKKQFEENLKEIVK